MAQQKKKTTDIHRMTKADRDAWAELAPFIEAYEESKGHTHLLEQQNVYVNESARQTYLWLVMMTEQLDAEYNTSKATWPEVSYYLFQELIHVLQDCGATPNDLHELIEQHHNSNCYQDNNNQ